MNKLIIEGGSPLRGEYPLTGAKNSVLKLMVAALLTEEPVILKNVPRISDVNDLCEIIRFLGGAADWSGEHEVTIQAKKITAYGLPVELAKRNRATFLAQAPLLARFGQASLPVPGGDQIGRRPVSPHIQAFQSLGARVKIEKGFYTAESKGKSGRLVGTTHAFRKNTHTGTDCAIMAASLAWGVTRLENAAQEPEIDNLIELINLMGGKIKRIQPRVIEIEGVEQLGGASFKVMPDRIVAATIATAAAATAGDVFIQNAPTKYLTAFLTKLTKIGVQYQVSEEGLRVWRASTDQLVATEIVTRPHPGFLTDWMAPTAVLLTQATGESLIHETIHPDRFAFARQLKRMGAEIHFFNPEVEDPLSFYNFDPVNDRPEYTHAMKVFGPTALQAAWLDAADIRAGAALVLAALVAEGTSEVHGVEHINRGYEDLVINLRALGAKITPENG